MWCDIKYGMMNMKHDHGQLVTYYLKYECVGCASTIGTQGIELSCI
jgi:hypothetical protein